MILNDKQIRELCVPPRHDVLREDWLRKNRPMVEPFTDSHLNGHSYDVTLSDHFVSPHAEARVSEFVLQPGAVVLASTAEFVHIPKDLAAYLSLKSSIARQWINHAMAGWIYPGFAGNITLELMNVGPHLFTLKAGMRIAQLTFIRTEPAAFHHVSTLPGTVGTVAVNPTHTPPSKEAPWVNPFSFKSLRS